MTRCPQAPRIVLRAIAVSSVAFPVGAASQTGAEPFGHALRTAVSEALESPFHASSGTGARVALAMAGPGPAPAPLVFYRSSDSLPSFGQVFLPTLAVTYLTDLLAYAVRFGPGEAGKGQALILTVPAVVPGLVAGRIGGRYGLALAGSAFGTAVALLSVHSDSLQVLAAAPAVHATLTTLGALSLR